MAESIKVAGRELVPIATGYAPHAYVFAVDELTYHVGPCREGAGYTLRCVTVETEAEVRFDTLAEAVAHASRRPGPPRSRPHRRPLVGMLESVRASLGRV